MYITQYMYMYVVYVIQNEKEDIQHMIRLSCIVSSMTHKHFVRQLLNKAQWNSLCPLPLFFSAVTVGTTQAALYSLDSGLIHTVQHMQLYTCIHSQISIYIHD